MKSHSPLTPAQLEALRKLLPKRLLLEYQAEENVLLLTLSDYAGGIHSDSCAFEAWVLLLHERALGRRIVLDAPASAGDPASGQLLYRAYQFSLLVYDWFSLSAGLGSQVAAFMDQYRSREKYYVVPNRMKQMGERGEDMLLSRFSCDESVLYAMPECEGTRLHTRLPVELYWEEAGGINNRVFPHTKPVRIDLWTIHNEALNLFLLKYQSPRMSVVSELFYYTSLLRDIFLHPAENRITLAHGAQDGLAPFFEGEALRPIKRIDAWFLCDSYHPLFEPIYLCDMLNTKSVEFHSLTYSCDLPAPSLQA